MAFDTEDLEDHLVVFILADATVSGLIGTRLWPEEPAGEPIVFPYALYTRIDTIRAGRRLETAIDPLPSARVQIDVWGLTRKSARRAAKAIRQRCDGYAGVLDPSNTATRVQRITAEDLRDNHETPQFADEVGVYGCSLDLLVRASEPEA